MTKQDNSDMFDLGGVVDLQALTGPGGFTAKPQAWTGYRLKQLQVQNFGGFHVRPLTVAADGESAVLVGGNGAGKSTAIDAFRTLVRANPSYNSATGGKHGDRSLRSYYVGQMGEGENGKKLRAVGMPEYFMAILAVFQNGDGSYFSIARLTYFTPSDTAQHRYITAQRPLSLHRDFKTWEKRPDLEARMERIGGKSHPTFDKYMDEIATVFGFEETADCNEAFRLLDQAIGAKSISNVTDFSRDYLFPPSDFMEVFNNSIGRTKAKLQQIEHIRNLETRIEQMKSALEALAYRRSCEEEAGELDLLQRRLPQVETSLLIESKVSIIDRKREKLIETQADLREADREIEHLSAEVLDLQALVRESGANKIHDLDRDIRASERRVDDLNAKLDHWTNQFSEQSLTLDATSHDSWNGSFDTVVKLEQEKQTALDEISLEQVDLQTDLRAARAASVKARDDLKSLEDNKIALDRRQIDMRAEFARALGLAPADLPFFAELVQVRDDEAEWEGVANRVLRGFAEKIMVPEDLYQEAKRTMNSRRWGTRVRLEAVARVQTGTRLRDGSLASKLIVKNDYPYAETISQILSRIANLDCLTEDEFARSDKPSCTKEGSIQRHAGQAEKDDRADIQNRSSWVLGWSIEGAIRARRDVWMAAYKREREIEEKVEQCNAGVDHLHLSLRKISVLLSIKENDYDKINPNTEMEALDRLREQRRLISTEEAEALVAREKAAVEDLEKARDKKLAAHGEASKLEDSIKSLEEGLEVARGNLATAEAECGALSTEDEEKLCAPFARALGLSEVPSYAQLVEKHLRGKLGSLMSLTGKTSEELSKTIRKLHERASSSFNKAQGLLSDIRRLSPQERDYLPIEFSKQDDEPCSAEKALRSRLEEIQHDNLMKVKPLVLDGYVPEIQAAMRDMERCQHRFREVLDARVRDINDTLQATIFDPRTMSTVRLLLEPVRSPHINKFTNGLRKCLNNSLEARPEDIKDAALEFLAQVDPESPVRDEAMMKEVADLRNWYAIKIEEKKTLRNGSSEINVIENSGHMSGGEKERLANLLNAAGLHCAFGNHDPVRRDRGLHLIILDEAFSNSTTESAQATNRIFGLLDLQVLTASPEAKVNNYLNHAKKLIGVSSTDGQVQLQEINLEKLARQQDEAE